MNNKEIGINRRDVEDIRLITELRINELLPDIRTVEEGEIVLRQFEVAIDRSQPMLKRFRAFVAGESKLGRTVGQVIDFITIFTPFTKQVENARDLVRQIVGRKQKQNQRPMLRKVLSIRNIINVKDENGNFSYEELMASVIQIAVAVLVVWGAVELGIWDQLSELIVESGE